ncbi:MAG: hypothetical protein AB8B82_16505 [Roseovarius sp.]
MKKRWMKSVIEASKQDMPALPFQRYARNARRTTTTLPRPSMRQIA